MIESFETDRKLLSIDFAIAARDRKPPNNYRSFGFLSLTDLFNPCSKAVIVGFQDGSGDQGGRVGGQQPGEVRPDQGDRGRDVGCDGHGHPGNKHP